MSGESVVRILGGRDLGGHRTDLAIEGGRLAAPPASPSAPGGVLDASGLRVAPGFVDVQCNGGHGIDLLAEPQRMWELAEILPRYGVTAWLPTIVSSGPEVRAAAARVVLGGAGHDRPVAVPLGLHLEGPALNPARAGAHDRRMLREPAEVDTDGWRPALGIRLVTVAPELPGALDLVAALSARAVVVQAGHTDATAEQLAAAADRGLSGVTHLFNAMPPFLHRAPGVAGAALADVRVRCGLIVDGIHVHPVAVAAAWRALGPSRTVLVSDAVAALGLPHGTTRLGTAEVTVGPDGVRLADGTLAGSALSLDRAVCNLVTFTGCEAADAVAAASTTPAALLGDRSRGSLAAGGRADVVLLDDDLRVAATLVGGRVAHLASGHEGRLLPT